VIVRLLVPTHNITLYRNSNNKCRCISTNSRSASVPLHPISRGLMVDPRYQKKKSGLAAHQPCRYHRNVHDESAICLEIAASSTRSCRLPGASRRFKCLGTRLQVSSPFLSFFVYQPRRTPKPTSRVPRYFRRTIRYAGGSAIKEHKSLCESANDTLPLEWCLFRMRCTVAVSALCYERANHRAEQRPGTTFCIPRTMLSPTVDSAIYLD
jgi:hypothetical protein